MEGTEQKRTEEKERKYINTEQKILGFVVESKVLNPIDGGNGGCRFYGGWI